MLNRFLLMPEILVKDSWESSCEPAELHKRGKYPASEVSGTT